MTEARATEWLYRGLWAGLVRWFRVPAGPPTLPAAAGERIERFRPAPGFVRYLRLWFWIGLAAVDGILFLAWLIIVIRRPWLGALLAPIFIAAIILPDIVAYVAIHLRFDTTWYVLSGRSLRIRRGIWNIHETTITFENVQNVTVEQGPVQRHYGIADILVKTAGGGGGQNPQEKRAAAAAHRGLIEGVADAARLRDMIMARVRRSRKAGLGDEGPGEEAPTPATGWTAAHIEALRQIRDTLRTIPGE